MEYHSLFCFKEVSLKIIMKLFKYLWLPALLFITAATYERGIKEVSDEYQKLEILKTELALQKKSALLRKVNLERQVMSQSDPNWITLTLIRVLGVVPEGQTKIYFKEP